MNTETTSETPSAPAEKSARPITLEFKWTTSRGRDTYGYNVCTLRANGRKVARCNGGGYDMKGTCLGSYLEVAFADRLRALKESDMPENHHWQPDRARVCDSKCKDEYNRKVGEAIKDWTGNDLEKALNEIKLARLPEDCFECPTCKGSTRLSNEGKQINDGRFFYGLRFYDPNYDPGKAIIGKDCNDRTLSKNGSEGETVEQAEKARKSFGLLERLQAAYKASSTHATERHTVPSIDGACGFSSVEQIAKAIGLSLRYVNVRSSKLDVYELTDAKS